MAQREKPGIDAEELAARAGVDPSGVKVGGGQIEAFRKGWAHCAFSRGMTAHYFIREDFRTARAACGYEAPVSQLYGRGNLDRCRRCLRSTGMDVYSGEVER